MAGSRFLATTEVRPDASPNESRQRFGSGAYQRGDVASTEATPSTGMR
jgi:hypothetical protein